MDGPTKAIGLRISSHPHELKHVLVALFIACSAVCKTTATASVPERLTVASINVCADQLILALAAPSQILSLSYLSHDKSASHFQKLAKQYPTNRAQAEEILPLRPTVVIAGEYTDHYTLLLLRRIGLDVKILPVANSMNEMIENVRLVSSWIGQKPKGLEIIESLQQRLANLPPIGRNKPSIAVYDPNGYTVGSKTLRGDMLLRAGWHNVATDEGIEQFGSLSLETMVRLRPDAILESPYNEGTWSHAQALNRHPALVQRGINTEIISIDSSDVICAGPWSVAIVEELSRRRKNLEPH